MCVYKTGLHSTNSFVNLCNLNRLAVIHSSCTALVANNPRIGMAKNYCGKKGGSPHPFDFPVFVGILQLKGRYTCLLLETVNRFSGLCLVSLSA